MKRVYLLRHAKSSWDDAGLDDHDRPLAARGRRAAKLIAQHLRRERIEPDVVLCSPARRARETLEGISPALGEQVPVLTEPGLYGASAGELLEHLGTVAESVESAMLIGHNPGIQELALILAGGGEEVGRTVGKFPTAALATLEFEGGWRELEPGMARLEGFVRPKDLG